MNAEDTVATVWVIGDRNDSECYQQTARRLQAVGDSRPEVVGFAAVMLSVMERRVKKKKAKKKAK